MKLSLFKKPLSLHSCWKPVPHVTWTERDGEVVVVDAQEGKVYRFNGVGAAVWTALCQNIAAGDIALRLADRFEAPLPSIQNDALKFLAELRDQDLIELQEKV